MDAWGWPLAGSMTVVRLSDSRRKKRERRVFSRSRPRRLPPWRQGLEGFLMVSLGVGLLAFLAWLPRRFDALVFVSEMLAELIGGLTKLLSALMGLGSVLLIAAVLLAGLVCVLGGSTRIVRATVRLFSASQSSARRRPVAGERRPVVGVTRR